MASAVLFSEQYLDALAEMIAERITEKLNIAEPDEYITQAEIARRTGYCQNSIHNFTRQMYEAGNPGIVRKGNRITRVSWNAFQKFMLTGRKQR